ncbi:TraB/GumN family protein [Fulvivirga kasyanovii]|uniref:TraB/GumN family protein n=1 Tax=Fulvivirga kasyanovii TaxID=396812 RepID=A0ABW9RP68_9BACT|nr:TraB/GumN family protein [Fulvivirga kasyanovii]MTI25944.1 TraB/GumN family protein [Fulvivirga kasyanovii]
MTGPNLKSFLLSLALIITAPLICISQTDDNANAVLWEVSGNGLSKPSYLYGIVNFLPKKEYSVPRKVKNVMKDCEVFATKLISDNSSQKKFNKAVRIPNDGWINDYLTDDELNQLRLLLMMRYDVREHAYHYNYSRLQPIILVTATTALDLDKNITFPEEELSDIARKNKMTVKGLGTIQEEIDAFEKFPIKDQVEALKYTVNNFEQHLKDYDQLVKYYIEDENLEKVSEETLKATNKSEPFQQYYYTNRIKNWFPEIKNTINNNSTFFALGAPFLAGDNGLIQLLREEGFEVKPVSVTKEKNQ